MSIASRVTFPALFLALLVGPLLRHSASGDEPKPVPPSGVATFHGRKIDIAQQLHAFPFDIYRWSASAKKGRLAYLHHVDGKALVAILDLKSGALAGDLFKPTKDLPRDWSTSLTFGWEVADNDGHLFFTADVKNNERFNVYEINPDTGDVKQWSDVAYVPDFNLSPDETKIAYTERMGKEGSRFRLHVVERATGKDTVVAEDTTADQFTWYEIGWQPGDKGLILTTLTNGNRNRGNIAYVPLDGQYPHQPKVITDRSVPRSFPQAMKDWLSADEALFTSPESGARNVHSVNIKTGETKQLTKLGQDVQFAEVTRVGDRRLLVVGSSTAIDGTILTYDLDKPVAEPVAVLQAPFIVRVLAIDGARVWYHKASAIEPGAIEEVVLSAEAPRPVRLAGLSPEAVAAAVQGTAEPILFPTFDDIPLTVGGKPQKGRLHGMLYKPRNPLPHEQALLMVEAFYGGQNSYNPEMQLYLAAGIHVFSPAPRGSSFFDARLEQANDNDMGGNDMLDIIYAARHVSELLKIPSRRVGAFGMSHGGYATLRLLTFPQKFNGRDSDFAWGFGIAEAPVTSLQTGYQTSNIKGWYVKEGGDPSKPDVAKRWEERSPVNGIDRLSGQVLLIHGTSDERVRFAESKAFVESATKGGKAAQVRLVPIEGAGHGLNREADKINAWQERLKFLEGQK